MNSVVDEPDLIHSYFIGFSYVFSAPDQLLESMPGTLMLTDCLEACQANESCGAVNYETGLCVLFSSNADKLPGKCNIAMEIERISVLYCNYDECNGNPPRIRNYMVYSYCGKQNEKQNKKT